MKKKFLTIVAVTTLIVSCNKQKNVVEPQSSINTQATVGTLTSARVIPQGDMENYVKDATDPQNERINYALYNYMVGMRKVFEADASFLPLALNLAKQTPMNAINLHEFICHTAICKTIFNGELCAKYPEKGTAYDHCIKLLEEMDYKYLQYNKDSYEPAMYIINANTADLTQGYYLALGTEAYNADEKHDYIAAWHILKNGTTRLELLNEQQAKKSSEPVLIFNPIAVDKYYIPAGENPTTYHPPIYTPPILDKDVFIPPAPPAGNNFVPYQVKHEFLSITQHFEQYGPSEVRISSAITNSVGAFVGGILNNSPLTDVPSNYVDCGCTWPVNKPFFNAINYNNVMHMITFEYDWFATKRTVWTNSVPFIIQSKFDHERYLTLSDKVIGNCQLYYHTGVGTNIYELVQSGQNHAIGQ